MTHIFRESVLASDATTLPSSDALRRAFINEWKVEPQADDREPVLGAGAPATGSSSARRSKARQKHQAKFKEWSQERHD